MRPIRPEPEEKPKIKRAMRAARIMNFAGQPVAVLGLVAALIVGGTFRWYFGVAVFVVILAPFFIFVGSAARCPRCGQVWWGRSGDWERPGEPGYAVIEQETESMVCRRCRLDIGLGMREP